MKHIRVILFILCLATFTACEKGVLEETTQQVDDQKNNGSSNDDTTSGDEDGSDKGDDTYSPNDSTEYRDSDSDGALEPDVVDGNENSGGNSGENTGDNSGSNTGSSSGGSTSGNTGGSTGTTDSNLTVDGVKAYNVTTFLNQTFNGQIWVVGYIVGDCTKSIKNANFDAPFSQPQALLLADSPDERSTDKVMSVQLSSESRKNEFSLKANLNNKGRRLAVYGYQIDYLGILGMKSSGKGAGIGAMKWYNE